MSRIGKAPIKIPAGVELKVNGNVFTVKGPKGELSQTFDPANIELCVENGEIIVKRFNEENATKAKHGLYRALAYNMVVGVTEGYKKTLIVNGVGWKVAKQGKKVVMNVGFSHPVEIEEIDGIALDCPTQTEITVSGIDKEKVGQFAAMVRGVREPEPYHGYGIRYSDEVIERKVGKAAGAKG